jgi:hypothetical protein
LKRLFLVNRRIAQSQLSQALMRLDKEVRYASYIGATSPARPYVEYRLLNDVIQQCVQLRIASTAYVFTWTVT